LIAEEAEVELLALTHISTRYPAALLRDEARAVFADTEAPRDFDTIEVPFPERGRAKLERWSERQARERAGGGAAPDDVAGGDGGRGARPAGDPNGDGSAESADSPSETVPSR